MASGNTTPLAIDFLSDPGSTLAAVQKVYSALGSLHQTVSKLVAAFKHMDAALTGAGAVRLNTTAAAAAKLNTSLASGVNHANALKNALSGMPSPGAPGKGGGGGGDGMGGGDAALGVMAMAGKLGKGVGIAAIMAAIGAEIKHATGEAMDFEQAMAGVAAVGEIDKTSDVFKQLEGAARSGSKQFTSTEKAGGLRELVAAGMSATQAMGALAPSLQLATAGEMSMSRASEIMVASMSAFHLKAEQSSTIVDTLTAAANASPASIEDMGEAMKFIAPVASALNVSIQDTSAAIAILANSGIRGGMAGRGLGAVMARLVAPTKEAEAAMKAAGVTAKELNPAIVGLQKSLEGLSRLDQEALVRLFGAENLDVSNVLASNAQGFGEMAEKMNSAAGAGERFAAALAETSAGKLKEMKNSITELEISAGKLGTTLMGAVSGPLTSAIGHIQSGVDQSILDATGANKPEGFSAKLKRLREGIEGADSDKALALAKDAARSAGHFAGSNREKNAFFGLVDDADSLNAGPRKIRAQAAAIAAEQAKADAAAQARHQALVDRDIANQKTRDEARVGPFMAGVEEDDPNDAKAAEKRATANRKTVFDTAIDAASKQGDLNNRLRDYNALLEISEAKASGDNKLAERLETELAFLKEKKRLMENMNMEEGAAGALALRSITASKAGESRGFTGVADSLQNVGGGGNIFAGGAQSLQQQQLRVQEQIRDGIKALGTGGTRTITLN